jgi:hypothetical protein
VSNPGAIHQNRAPKRKSSAISGGMILKKKEGWEFVEQKFRTMKFYIDVICYQDVSWQ